MVKIRIGLMVLGLTSAAAPLVAQQAPRVTVTGRVQVQFNSTSVSEEDADSSVPIALTTFETRRVRLGASVRIDDRVDGYIESDVAMGRLALKQVWMRVAFDSTISGRAGQFKKPFGLVELLSSAQLPMIERGVRIRGLSQALEAASSGELAEFDGDLLMGDPSTLVTTLGYAGYDMGAGVDGSHDALAWSVGIFNGNGPDARDENDGKSFAARMQYAVTAGRPLVIGAGWSRRELSRAGSTTVETRAGNAFGVDAQLGGFRQGWWVIADLMTGTNLVSNGTFTAAQGVVSHFRPTPGAFVEGVEAVGRISWGDPDRSVADDAGMLLTPGVNLYFAGRNRLMFNWDVYMPAGDAYETHHAARAQANLYF